MRKVNRRNLLHPPAALVVPSMPDKGKVSRELAAGRSDSQMALSLDGYRTRIGKLKAYANSIAHRYRASVHKEIQSAEKKYLQLLRETWRGEERDPVLDAIKNKPATSWLHSQLVDYLNRDEEEGRQVELDPICEKITHYKRVGKRGLYAFKCYLRSHRGRRAPQACFWLKYLELVKLPSAQNLLNKYGWNMKDYWHQYSEGESVWDDHSPSSSAEWHLPPEKRFRARKARSGLEKVLIKRRRTK